MYRREGERQEKETRFTDIRIDFYFESRKKKRLEGERENCLEVSPQNVIVRSQK